jgi:hypothetical protein
MNEKVIEKKLVREIKIRGGKAIKFQSFYETKFPDRLILMPGGIARWAECKTSGKKLDPGQQIRKKELESLGFKVDVIDDEITLQKFLNDL